MNKISLWATADSRTSITWNLTKKNFKSTQNFPMSAFTIKINIETRLLLDSKTPPFSLTLLYLVFLHLYNSEEQLFIFRLVTVLSSQYSRFNRHFL